MYGGFIEVITSLRNELKRRDENSKEISALKTHVQKLEEKIGSFIESTPQKSTQNREEQWYDDIVRKNKGVIYGGMKMQKKLVIPIHLEQVLQAFLLTFQRYFHLYLKEIEFRFNNRDENIFEMLAKMLVKPVPNE